MTRRSALTQAVLFALLATLLVPAPAAAFHEPGGFLVPAPGEFVHGTIPVEVFHDEPSTEYVQFDIRWLEDGEFVDFTFDSVGPNMVPGLHGHIFEDIFVPGHWAGLLEMPPFHPEGSAWFRAFACSEAGCDADPFAEVEVYADGLPPLPDLNLPDGGVTSVAPGEEVPVEIEMEDPDTEGVELFIQALFPKLIGKGLPLLDQHDVGAKLSTDTDNDGSRGDMSCAPTAAASSLSWFDRNGHPTIVGAGVSDADLTDTVGKHMGTDSTGSSIGGVIKGLKDYLNEVKLGDAFDVERVRNPSLDSIQAELGRKQDVLLALYWDGGGGHLVAANDYTKHEDGSVDIQVMDPWAGTYETVHVDKDGNATHKGNNSGLRIGNMIHVSPKKSADEKKVGAATPPAQGMTLQQAGTYRFTLDTSTLPAGDYLVRAQATDGTVSLNDFAVLRVERDLPGGFDGDPATTERLDAIAPTDLAVASSQARFSDGTAVHAVLSRDDAFPDSLAGSALTAEGPLLFTTTAALPQATRDELARVLGPGRTVYLLGGVNAISQAVADQLTADGYTVARLSGPSRVETSIAVADEVRRLYPGVHPAALARAFGTTANPSAGWADAVTAGAWAAATGTPILVTGSDTLHPAVSDWLTAHPVSQTVLLGGPAALSNAIASSVPSPLRVHGAARDETAAQVSRQLWDVDENTPGRRFVIIDGHRDDGWALGLAAAGLAADFGAPVLVTSPNAVPAPTLDLVTSCGTQDVDLLLAGSDTVISAERQAELDGVDGRTC